MMSNCFLVLFLVSILGNVANGQKSPTVVPAIPFNPVKDAEGLQKAMKGFGSDEAAIIEILAKRTTDQRLQIGKSYKTSYGKDLLDDLKLELSGKFSDTIVALFYQLPQLYAKELYEATYGLGTDDEAVIEILTSLTNYEIKTIAQVFEQTYGNALEAVLIADTSGKFQRLCVSLIQGNRNLNQGIDIAAALADATALFEADADASTFNSIFVTRSYQQLSQIFTEYEKIAGHNIEKAIKDKFSGSTASGFLAIVQWSKSYIDFYVDRLHNAMSGWFTNHKTLIRIVVSRSELDLGAIKIAYHDKYGKSLETRFKELFSGDYRDVLLVLVGSD